MTVSNLKEDYIGRINKALKYIDDNLHQDLSLEFIAEKASYSPFHFHRIFRAITDETLNGYINRKRVEKIAGKLLRNKNISMGDLAAKYGFNSSVSFSRSFKKFYGISPTEFKEQSPGMFSKIGKEVSKNGKTEVAFEKYICNINQLKKITNMKARNIEVKTLPVIDLAYLSHVGDCNLIGNTFEKLIKWARPKGLMDQENTKMVTVYHDDPKVTDPEKMRYSVGIILNEKTQTGGEVGNLSIANDKYIVGNFEIAPPEFEKSWHGLFLWITENGYRPKDGDYFEVYHNDYREHPENKFNVDFCVPVE